jgi:hypothetical protein
MNDESDKEVSQPTDKTATERKPDSREVLNELRQSVVVALLSQGFSRRTAARHVGVSHTSIARAAARDPHFAKKMSDAESVADYSVLKTVRDAGRQEKYWRAAAWLLERRLPDEFGHRAPHSFSGDQVMTLLAEILSYALPALKDDRKDQFMRSFNGTLREVEAAAQNADRWRDRALDDRTADDSIIEDSAAGNGGVADVTPLRSPYEHPDWYEPAAAGHADSAAPTMATSDSGRNGDSRPAEAGTTSAKDAPAEAGATSANEEGGGRSSSTRPTNSSVLHGGSRRSRPHPTAGDVCQSSQEGGARPVNRIRRNLLAANGLAKPSRSVPKGRKPRGGTDNGRKTGAALTPCPSPNGREDAILGNGAGP